MHVDSHADTGRPAARRGGWPSRQVAAGVSQPSAPPAPRAGASPVRRESAAQRTDLQKGTSVEPVRPPTRTRGGESHGEATAARWPARQNQRFVHALGGAMQELRFDDIRFTGQQGSDVAAPRPGWSRAERPARRRGCRRSARYCCRPSCRATPGPVSSLAALVEG
jgi:hypothetical protein